MLPLELTDGVVRLSLPTPDDVDRIAAVCQEPDIQAWTTMPSPYTRADAESFVTGYVRDGWAGATALTWGVREVAGGGTLVGMIGLGMQPVASAELGYWLAGAARGRGLMHRAGRLVVEHAFDAAGLDLDRLEWRAYPDNWASWRVAWRLGFRFEGAVRGEAVQRGVRRDAWLGTLLRADTREPAEPWTTSLPLATSEPPRR